MIRLCLSQPGTGKSHWLRQRAKILVPCTNKSHRAILCATADALALSYPTRASIDDLISLILAAPPTELAYDDIDRTAGKFCYSLLTLSQNHTIYATATEKRRIKPLLDRQAAIIEAPPPAPIPEIIASRYPDLPPEKIRQITALAQTPGAAINIAESIRHGTTLPAPPTTNIFPIITIAALAILTLLYKDSNLSPITLALIGGIILYARKLIWRSR